MARSVTITTPVPSLAEFGDSLGLTKARQESLISIMRGEPVKQRASRQGFPFAGVTAGSSTKYCKKRTPGGAPGKKIKRAALR